MYLKLFLTREIVNLWFNPSYTFMFYSLICGLTLYSRENADSHSIELVFLWSIMAGTGAVVFTKLNYYINSQLSLLSLNFFTTRRLVAKTLFYIVPFLLAITVVSIFPNGIFHFRIVNNPLVYLILVLPYEVFEYLRLDYQNLDEA